MRIIQLLIPGISKRVLEVICNEIYSTRNEYLSVKLKDTNDSRFGVVHTKTNAQEDLATKTNAQEDLVTKTTTE